MDHEEIRRQVVDWIELVRDKAQWRALVSTVMNQWDSRKQGPY
jgi:hypothetical protein